MNRFVENLKDISFVCFLYEDIREITKLFCGNLIVW